MIVRPLRATDLPQLATLAQAVHQRDGYPPHLPRHEVASYVASDAALAAWVATEDNRVVGHVALHPSESADGIELASTTLRHAHSEFGVIARLLVDPTIRRSGVGRQLLHQATTDCRRRGLIPILEVVDRFEPAIELYERAGWRRIGTIELQLPDGSDLREHVYVTPRTSKA